MAEEIHVNGEALVRVGTGTSGALETLGVSVDGVEFEIMDHVAPVYTDTFGGPEGVPFDEQNMLQDARGTIQLVFYEESVLAKLRKCMVGAANEGVMPNAGTLYGKSGNYFRLLILSPNDGLPWNFLKARIDGAKRVKVGTRRNIWNLNFYAIPYSGSSGGSSGAVLYNRVTS